MKTIFGHPTGCTAVTVFETPHRQVAIDVETDFGKVRGILDHKGAKELILALLEITGPIVTATQQPQEVVRHRSGLTPSGPSNEA